MNNSNRINNTTATTSNDRTLIKSNLLSNETSDVKQKKPITSNISLLSSPSLLSHSLKKLKFNEGVEDKENINIININDTNTLNTINKNNNDNNKALDQKSSSNNVSLKNKIKHYTHRLSNNTLMSATTTATSTTSPFNVGSNSAYETNVSNKTIHHNIIGVRYKNIFDNKQSHR